MLGSEPLLGMAAAHREYGSFLPFVRVCMCGVCVSVRSVLWRTHSAITGNGNGGGGVEEEERKERLVSTNRLLSPPLSKKKRGGVEPLQK